MTQRRTSVDYLEDIRQAAEKAVAFLGGLPLATFEADRTAALAGNLGDDARCTFLAGRVVDDHGRPLVGQVLRDRGCRRHRPAALSHSAAEDTGEAESGRVCFLGHMFWETYRAPYARLLRCGVAATPD
jgi:hypothetical protein